MFRRHISAALLLLTVTTLPALADASTPEKIKILETLDTLITNMGYTTTYATDKSHFSFDVSGKYDYHVDVTVSSNGELVYFYDYIDTFNAAQLAKVPYQKMMEYQNSGNVFFSMDGSSGKGDDFFFNEVFGYAGLTTVKLRGELDHFTNALTETDQLWNKGLWK